MLEYNKQTNEYKMKIGTKEFYDIMANFEKSFSGNDFTKEPKEMWYKGYYYCNGTVNSLFLGFQSGYSAGRLEYLNQ